MRTIILGLAMVAAAFAQDTAQQAEARAQKLDAEAAATKQTFLFLGGQMMNGKVIKAAPYSAEAVTESTQTLADGNKIVNKSSTMMYRDSEGRERREESIGNLGSLGANATPTKAIFISDPVAKVNYSLDPQAKTARKSSSTVFTFKADGGQGGGVVTTTGAMSLAVRDERMINQTVVAGRAGEPGGQAIGYSYRFETGTSDGPAKPAPNTEQLGTKMIEGVSAVGTRTTITIPAGQIGNERDIVITNERWYSPDLQMTVMTRSTDPRMGETVYRITNVSRSEPMPSLFEVPSDYKTIEPGPTARKVITKDE